MAGIVIYNAATENVVARFDGASYVFKPGERKEIFVTFAANHILGRWGKYGLVDITYNDKVAKEYLAPELYVHKQSIDGIKKYIETLEDSDVNFNAYDGQFGEVRTPERATNQKHHKALLAKLDVARKRLEELEGTDTNKLIEQCAADMKKRAEQLLNKAKAITHGKDGIGHSGRSEDRVARS